MPTLSSWLSSLFSSMNQPRAAPPDAAPAQVAAPQPADPIPAWYPIVVPLTKVSEGCRLMPYRDVGGVWTNAWGHTGSDADLPCTQAQADQWLHDDLMEADRLLMAAVRVPLSPQQRAALVDLIYNVGPGRPGARDGILVLKKGTPSTLLKRLNAGDYAGAAAQFPEWSHAGGIVVGGLLKRRQREQQLFLTGEWT